MRKSTHPQSDEWLAKNARRGELIRKKISGALSAIERRELEKLQAEADEHLLGRSPLPLDELEAFKSLMQP
jgi:uncharacterized protein (DUF924 family)